MKKTVVKELMNLAHLLLTYFFLYILDNKQMVFNEQVCPYTLFHL